MASSSSASATPASEEAPVLFESAYSTRTFVLNRPKALNALDQDMINMITPKVADWDKSDLCKIIVARGNGSAFCAGGEVKSLAQYAADPAKQQKAIDYFKSEFQLDYNLATLETPYVAIMDGITMGGGVGLSAYAPFRIATPRTIFAMPETKIGYAPDVGVTYILGRLDGEIGTYLALTGNTLSGAESFRVGLATHYVPESRIPQLLERLGGFEGTPSRGMINAAIEEFAEDVDGERLGAKGTTSVVVGPLRKALDYAFAPSEVEGIIERLEELSSSTSGAEEVRQWAKQTLKELELRSPTSLRIALEAVRRANSEAFRLSDAFQQELGIATACVSGATPDFVTGITAVLIDKITKKDPSARAAWSPSTLSSVSSQWIKSTFFSSSSPHVSSAPRISPGPSGRSTADINLAYWALPTESALRMYVSGKSEDSGDFAVSVGDVVAKFEASDRNGGEGKKGVRGKVLEVVDRCCEVKDGWLKWKY